MQIYIQFRLIKFILILLHFLFIDFHFIKVINDINKKYFYLKKRN